MVWLAHLPRICPGKEGARTHDRLFNEVVVGPGIVGPDAKAIGPRPAQHLSGPRGARHDACADPRNALKNKTARTTTRTSRQFND